MRCIRSILSTILFAVVLAESLMAQTVEVVERRGQLFMLTIDGHEYLALPASDARKQLYLMDSLQTELEFARRTLAVKDSLILTLQTAIQNYARHFWLQDTLLRQTTRLYQGYRNLYYDYRTQFGEPWLTLSGGLGAVRSRENSILPVFLMGLSIRRLSIWAFLNREQSGFLFGITSPVRIPLFFR